MKLKPNWLETLSDTARRVPQHDLPEAMPRTAARVLTEVRQKPRHAAPQRAWLVAGITAALAVTMGVWFWPQADEAGLQEHMENTVDGSWEELFEALDQDLAVEEVQSPLGSVPTDFLLADSKVGEIFDWSRP